MQKRPSRPKCTPSGKILHRARPKGWQREPELRHVPSTFSRTAHGETIFFNRGYIKQDQWAEIWQDCMKLDYTPQVDIRAIKPNKRASEESAADAAMTAAISETMKYPIKPDSLKLDAVESMSQQEQDELAAAVICLSHAMKGRRLVTFGGEILKARKALKQDDIEKGDLVEVGDTPTIENEYEFVLFNWMKMGCYVC